MTDQPGFFESLAVVARALDDLEIDYFVTGSLASATHGVARATADADIVVDLTIASYEALVARLGSGFYVPDSFARQAVTDGGMFNIIRVGALFKADLILLRPTEFDENAMRRAQAARAAHPYPTATPEDIILFKLQWLAAGGAHSQRQLDDVAGVVVAMGERLDVAYLRSQAATLGLESLLRDALGG